MTDKDEGASIRKILGDSIKHFRMLNHLSQEQLGERCETTGAYISEIERGEKWPSSDLLSRLATGLGVQPHSLLLPLSAESNNEELLLGFSRKLSAELNETITRIRSEFLRPSGK